MLISTGKLKHGACFNGFVLGKKEGKKSGKKENERKKSRVFRQ